MSTIRDEFEAWRSGEHDGLVKAFTAREMSAARAAFEFAMERAAKQEREDGVRLDWLERAGRTSIGMVVDAPHDGEYFVCPDTPIGYGTTLREAIDAAAIRAKGGSNGR